MMPFAPGLSGERKETMLANVCVFAPAVLLTITVELTGDQGKSAVHVHPGGQGFWVARMVRHLGERPILCAPIGGETGQVLTTLIPEWGVELEAIPTEAESPAYVHDRRDGTRREIAATPPPVLGRHEIDDLYGKTLETALSSGLCVVTGRFAKGGVPEDLYRRLGADLKTTEVPVVGDMHGDDLASYLAGGPLDVLKVSTEDLKADGAISTTEEKEIVRAIKALVDSGARSVVVSGAEGSTLAQLEGSLLRASQPSLEAADHRGSGDSMTAGLAVGLVRNLEPEGMLRLACAAGAANVVRHGLGSADAELISKLMDLVQVEDLGTNGKR